MRMICGNCEKECESYIKTIKEVYPVKGEDIEVEANVRFCEHCGEAMFDVKLDGENLQRAYRIYRERHHLLQPEQIKEIRTRYGLSQVAFSRVLGMGDKTIARYENGSIADKAQNNIIELASDQYIFMKLLTKNKESISPAEYISAMQKINIYGVPTPKTISVAEDVVRL